MNYHDKTKEELLKDLHDLQQKYDAISLLYETEKHALAALVENNSDAMLVKDCNRRIIAGNSAFIKATGHHTLAELIGKTDADILNIPENTEPVLSYKQEDLKALKLPSGEIIEREEKIPFPDGEWKTFLTKKFPIFIDKKLIGLGVITSDITKRKQAEQSLLNLNEELTDRINERKKAERALKESEEKFKKAFEIEHVAIAISRKSDGVYLDANPGFLKMTGYKYNEIVGHTSRELNFFSIGSRRILLDKLKEKGKLTNELLTYPKKSGEMRTMRYYIEPIRINNTDCLVATMVDITEQQKAENELKESEEKFRNLVDTIPYGIEEVNLEGKRTFLNKSYYDILGYKNGELIGTYIWDHDPTEEQKERVKSYFEKIIQEQPKPEPFISQNRKKDGAIIDVLVDWNYRYNEKKQLVGIFAVVTDITSQKAAEQKILYSQQRLKEAEKIGKLGHVDWNVAEQRAYWSDEIFRIYERDPELGAPGFETIIILHTTESAKRLETAVTAALRNGKNYDLDMEAIMPSGKKKILNIIGKPVTDKNGNVTNIVGTVQDITERKKNEIILRESEQRLKLAFQSAALGIWDWNVKENTMTWDERMFELYGATKKTFTKTVDAWSNGLHPDDKDRAIAECNDALKGIKDFDTTFRVMHPDGKVLYLKADGLVIRDSKGQAIRMIGVNRDITKNKQNEIELIKTKEKAEESNRLKTEFLNNMSHEIRTPMNGIIGFSTMFDKPDLPEEKRKYYSKIVQNSSQQLLRIIDDILEISTLETKQEKLNETEFCLNDLLMELFSVFNLKSKERNIPFYLKKSLHDEQSHIISDKTKLNKILGNLLENSLKFTSEGFIEFGYYLEKATLILYVKDTGIGISSKNHKIIYERFSQEDKEISSKHGGLGLGLSICKENSQLLGGDITLESEKGKGSTFYVSIPYKPAHTGDNYTSKSIDDKQMTNDNYTILVAEDEEVNYLYIEVLFEDEIEGNYNLIHAKNGKEAFEICTANNNIDLVLMDIKMPIMNGHEATEKIKEKFPNLPIIAQTAYSTESDKQLALKHGCDDFISKPIDKEKLVGLINKYLNIK